MAREMRRLEGHSSYPLGPLLFKLINGPLFLINLVSEAGQLSVMGLAVILHLQFQGLLRQANALLRARLPADVGTALAMPSTRPTQLPAHLHFFCVLCVWFLVFQGHFMHSF